MNKDNIAYVNGGVIEIDDINKLTMNYVYKDLLDNCDINDGITFYNADGDISYLSYYDIAQNSYNRMNMLHEVGLKPKDKVIFQCSNGKDFVDVFWACSFGGYVPALLNPIIDTTPTSQEALLLNKLIEMLDYPKVVVSNDIYDSYVEMFKGLGLDIDLLIPIKPLKQIKKVDNPVVLDNGLSLDDDAIIFFTSGSTGMPKGVAQSNRAIVSREIGVAKLNNFKKDVSLNWMPLEHAGGILMAHFRSIYSNSSQIQVDKEYILQNPLLWLDLMTKYKVGYSWAPHFAYELINKELENGAKGNWDLSSVTFLLNGGEMIDCIGAKKFLKLLKPYSLTENAIHPSWGMCETCSGVLYNNDLDDSDYSGIQVIKHDSSVNVTLCNLGEENSRNIMSIGKPIPGVEVRITDSNNNIVNEGVIGRFQIKGTPITHGYFKNEESNKESFTDDGWFVTGDLGFICDENLILTGREKNIIIINGLNYNNSEIEAAAETLPIVEKSYTAATSVRNSETSTDDVCVFFVPQRNINPYVARNEVFKVIKEKMHLTVNEVIPVTKDDIPKTNLGKIQRKQLSMKYENGGFNDILDNIKSYNAMVKNYPIKDWFLKEKFITSNNEKEQIPNNICYISTSKCNKIIIKLKEHFNNVENVTTVEEINNKNIDTLLFYGNFNDLQKTSQAIAKGKINVNKFYIITESLYSVQDTDTVSATNGDMIGLYKCLSAEVPNIAICNVDVKDINEDTEMIIRELQKPIDNMQIAYRNNIRYSMKLDKIKDTNNQYGFTYGGLYLVTGGLGGVAINIVKHLLKYYNASVVLIGRSDLKLNNNKKTSYEELRSISNNVFYEIADVVDKDSIEKIVSKYEKLCSRKLDYVIHTAGLGNLTEHWKNSNNNLIANANIDLYNNMFKAKVIGTLNLYSIINSDRDTSMIICGSTNSFFGNSTFAPYSAANSFVDTFAFSINDYKKVKTLNFSNWHNIGMSENNDFGTIGKRKGFCEIEAIDGILSIERALNFKEPSVFVGLDSSKEFIASYLCEKTDAEVDALDSSNNKTTNNIETIPEEANTLADIWKKILNIDSINLKDDFFELGGNSLTAMKLVSKVKSEYKVNYSLKNIFKHCEFEDMFNDINNMSNSEGR